jgi:hypothetical protein
MQNLPKREQFKKMQSRKISSHEEASDQGENSSDAEETKRQMLSKPPPKDMDLRSKSRGSKHRRQNIDDDDSGGQVYSGPSKSKTSSSGGNDSQANQPQRKVSKLRPKHMRNEAQEATRATSSMFTKPKPEPAFSDNDDDDDMPVEQPKHRKQRQEERSPSPQPQRERKSKTREGGRREKSNKKRKEIRDELSD